jgi:ketosteroid isomerase-like protein
MMQTSMDRRLTFLTIVAVLTASACTGSRKKPSGLTATESAQAIAALCSAYAAFNRGDIEAAVQSFDPQIDWTEPAEFPGGGTYHGREEVKRYLAQSRAAWAEGSSEPERFITSGNRIVVFVHARVRPRIPLKDSQQWQDVKLADVYTISNGHAIQMRAFADRHEALRWAGVEEPLKYPQL